MKNLKESLFDKKGTLDRVVYKYQPKTNDELRDCIKTELNLQGPDANLNIIDVSKITDMSGLFDLNIIDVSKITDMSGLFDHLTRIENIDISRWDVSNVENVGGMFWGCEKFNCDLSKLDVSNVNYMSGMFFGCSEFNSDLSKWDVSGVKDMYSMFRDCKKFNSNLSHWDVRNVKNMYYMFRGCKSLEKIPSWYKL